VDLSSFDFDQKQDVVISYEFEVEPEFELLALSDISFTKLEYETSDESVAEHLEKVRLFSADKNEVERASALGDQLLVSYKRTLDGQEKHFEKQEVLLRDKEYLPEFVSNLVGLKKDDQKSFSVTYPQNWGETELAGKTVDLDLTVLSVKEVIPASDEKLKQEFLGDATATDEALVSKIESILKEAISMKAFDENKERVLEALKNSHQIEIPLTLMPKDLQEESRRAEAEASVKMGIIINRYLAHHDIKLDNMAYFEHIAKQAYRYGLPINSFFDFVKGNEQFAQQMRYEVLINALVNKILDSYPSDKSSEKLPYDRKK
jgi:trigger factor